MAMGCVGLGWVRLPWDVVCGMWHWDWAWDWIGLGAHGLPWIESSPCGPVLGGGRHLCAAYPYCLQCHALLHKHTYRHWEICL